MTWANEIVDLFQSVLNHRGLRPRTTPRAPPPHPLPGTATAKLLIPRRRWRCCSTTAGHRRRAFLLVLLLGLPLFLDILDLDSDEDVASRAAWRAPGPRLVSGPFLEAAAASGRPRHLRRADSAGALFSSTSTPGLAGPAGSSPLPRAA